MIWNRDVETMPRPKLRELQLGRLRWSVRWAYDRVPFHRHRLDAAGVDPDGIRSLDDLRRLPFMVKSDLREHYPDGLFAVPRSEVVRIHASSGTNPFRSTSESMPSLPLFHSKWCATQAGSMDSSVGYRMRSSSGTR